MTKPAQNIYPDDRKPRARKGRSYSDVGGHKERSAYHVTMEKILREREKRER